MHYVLIKLVGSLKSADLLLIVLDEVHLLTAFSALLLCSMQVSAGTALQPWGHTSETRQLL